MRKEKRIDKILREYEDRLIQKRYSRNTQNISETFLIILAEFIKIKEKLITHDIL